MQEVAANVFVETAYPPLTVGALLTDQGWVIIDTPPMPRNAQEWREALRRISNKPILYLINTDAQRDRILGNSWFEAPLITHAAAAHHLAGLKGNFLAQAADEMSTNDNDMVAIASLRLLVPQVSFSENLSIFAGEYEIKLHHRPGPSSGNIWVILEAQKIAFTGDTLTLNHHPLMTEPNSKLWLASLTPLINDDYTGWQIIPGRGDPTVPQSAQALIDYFSTIRQRVGAIYRGSRPRSELGTLVPDLFNAFPIPSSQRDEMQRRIRATLETVYEEIRSNPPTDD